MIGTKLNKNQLDRHEYFEVSSWCNKNNCTIEDKGDYYEVVAIPEPEPIPVGVQYSDRVAELIRDRYTINDELAILRQRDEKPEEYAEYYSYCEECKTRAKQELGMIPVEEPTDEELPQTEVLV